ncbi:hypothetical protein LPJ71_011651, partial [Coemansia sp. S17]
GDIPGAAGHSERRDVAKNSSASLQQRGASRDCVAQSGNQRSAEGAGAVPRMRRPDNVVLLLPRVGAVGLPQADFAPGCGGGGGFCLWHVRRQRWAQEEKQGCWRAAAGIGSSAAGSRDGRGRGDVGGRAQARGAAALQHSGRSVREPAGHGGRRAAPAGGRRRRRRHRRHQRQPAWVASTGARDQRRAGRGAGQLDADQRHHRARDAVVRGPPVPAGRRVRGPDVRLSGGRVPVRRPPGPAGPGAAAAGAAGDKGVRGAAGGGLCAAGQHHVGADRDPHIPDVPAHKGRPPDAGRAGDAAADLQRAAGQVARRLPAQLRVRDGAGVADHAPAAEERAAHRRHARAAVCARVPRQPRA